MASLRFNSLLSEVGIDPASVRLLRHETKRHGKTPYALWRDDPARFNDYQRVQKRSRRAWFDAPCWASFVVTPDSKTLFAGLFVVRPDGSIPDHWIDPISKRDAASLIDYEIYASALVEPLQEFVGRLVIDWGVGTRSWTQLALNQDKPIIELRQQFDEPAFPGFIAFVAQLSDIPALPPSWKSALALAHGVYLLTCPRTNQQYIGSATGSGGFLGRWEAYVADGHGGNIELKMREPSDYRVSILQVAGSADGADAVLAMEVLWKAKLQSREMGLNRN